jgi:hypothetical protein
VRSIQEPRQALSLSDFFTIGGSSTKNYAADERNLQPCILHPQDRPPIENEG